MDIASEQNSYNDNTTGMEVEEKSRIDLAFLCLCAFALLRPLLSVKFFSGIGILGLNIFELFSVGISYILIVATIYCVARARTFRFDVANLIAMLFCLYLLSTNLVGSSIRESIRLVLPIFILFAVRAIVKNEKQIITLLLLSIISYIIPLIGSAWLILLGKSIGKTIYQTGLVRYEGMYLKIHTLAHCMFIFLFIFLYYLTLCKEKLKTRRGLLFFLLFLCICSLFCLFKSYTRNVWIGLFILLIFYFIGRRNYIVLIGIVIGAIAVIVMSEQVQTYFFDIIEPLRGEREIRHLGAGRFGMWTKIIHDFGKLPFEMKLLGVGIGAVYQGFEISRGHNDFISLLYTAGIMGLIIYVMFLLVMLYDILKSRLETSIKYLFLGFLTAVIFMNMASNSYLSRIEIGQYFYFIIGTFYILNDLKTMNKESFNHS